LNCSSCHVGDDPRYFFGGYTAYLAAPGRILDSRSQAEYRFVKPLAVLALLLSRVILDISMATVVLPNLINGFAGGLIFVPLTAIAMGRLPNEEIGNAAGIYNLMRNIGGSVGIASATTFLVRGSQIHQNYLAANVTAGNLAAMEMLYGMQTKFHLGGIGTDSAYQKAVGMLCGIVQQQASLLAYADNFRLLGCLALLSIPLAMLFYRVRKHSHDVPDAIAEDVIVE
jgi:MFS transporter, DHA2 family, multidrug resistance protein